MPKLNLKEKAMRFYDFMKDDFQPIRQVRLRILHAYKEHQERMHRINKE